MDNSHTYNEFFERNDVIYRSGWKFRTNSNSENQINTLFCMIQINYYHIFFVK